MKYVEGFTQILIDNVFETLACFCDYTVLYFCIVEAKQLTVFGAF